MAVAEGVKEITEALNSLVPALKAVGEVGIPIVVSLFGTGIVVWFAYKLPPLLMELTTTIRKSTEVSAESAEAIRSITTSFVGHHENTIQVKCDLNDLSKLAETIRVDMAKESHIAGLHTQLNSIAAGVSTIKALQVQQAKGAVILERDD